MGSEIQKAFEWPGFVGFRAYRPLMRWSRVILTVELARLEDWTSWYNAPNTQGLLDDLGTLTANLEMELWGPSPLVSERITPGPVGPSPRFRQALGWLRAVPPNPSAPRVARGRG